MHGSLMRIWTCSSGHFGGGYVGASGFGGASEAWASLGCAIIVQGQLAWQKEQMIFGRALGLLLLLLLCLAIETVHVANDLVALDAILVRGVLSQILFLVELVQMHGYHKVCGQLLCLLLGLGLWHLHLIGAEVETLSRCTTLTSTSSAKGIPGQLHGTYRWLQQCLPVAAGKVMLLRMEGLLRWLGEQILTGVEYGWQLGLFGLLLHITKCLIHFGDLVENTLRLIHLGRRGC